MKKLIEFLKSIFIRKEIEIRYITAESDRLQAELNQANADLQIRTKYLKWAIKMLDGRMPPDHLNEYLKARDYTNGIH